MGRRSGVSLQRSPAATRWRTTGACLWRSLRASVPDAIYHDGVSMTDFVASTDGVDVTFSDGQRRRFDALIAADGYRSAIRARTFGSQPDFAGYVLYRGNYPESRLTRRAAIDMGDEVGRWHTICFPGGHGVIYMIPNFDDRTDRGHRRVNWAIYAPTPRGVTFDEPTSIPVGEVPPDVFSQLQALLQDHFPDDYRAIVTQSPRDEVSVQPVYDDAVSTYAKGRMVLVGDAGTVTRPHTGSGATKALQDALALARLARAHRDLDELIAAYSAERSVAGREVVDVGRRVGRDQVEDTPDWASMDQTSFDAWTKATLEGSKLYLYQDQKRA